MQKQFLCDMETIINKAEKCRVWLTSNTQTVVTFYKMALVSSINEKLIGITFDLELRFEDHISKTCNIVNKKLNTLHCIANHISLDKRKIISKGLFQSQFSNCLPIWMFHSSSINNK